MRTLWSCVALAAALPAQFQGNGLPSAYVTNTPGVLGQQLTVGFGSPTAALPIAILGLSDGVGPVFVPGLGNVGLDLFSPAFQALTFGLDLAGKLTFAATASLDLGGGLRPPRGFHGATLLPNGDVLVTGGFVTDAVFSSIQGAAIPTTKCCVWSNGAWSVAAPLPLAVAFHAQEPHGSGALVVGGFTGDLTTLQTTAQVVSHDGGSTLGRAPIGTDGGSGTPQPRGTHTCTRLYDGTFLVYGGGIWPNTAGDGWVYTPN